MSDTVGQVEKVVEKMAKAKLTERLSFRTKKATRKEIAKLAEGWGYRSISDYLRDSAEAPLNPELLRTFADRYNRLLNTSAQTQG